MSDGLNQLAQGGLTLLVIIAVAIIVSLVLTLLRKYNITLKNLFGNTPLMNEVVDTVSQLIQDTVLEITVKISEKYQDDGVITKEELTMIKEEAISIILNKLSKTQNTIIQMIYGDLMKWITEQVDKELDKLVE